MVRGCRARSTARRSSSVVEAATREWRRSTASLLARATSLLLPFHLAVQALELLVDPLEVHPEAIDVDAEALELGDVIVLAGVIDLGADEGRPGADHRGRRHGVDDVF